MGNFVFRKTLNRTSYFNRVFRRNLFNGKESLSGEGSSLTSTVVIRREIPKLVEKFKIRTILDVPCGDMFWIRHILDTSITYTGADISSLAIKENRKKFSLLTFQVMDAVKEIPNTYDLIISRDLLVHLPLAHCKQVLWNFCESGSRYLLTTTFPDRVQNTELSYSGRVVQWRPLNLAVEPFNLPLPLAVIIEECVEGDGNFSDKSLALYDLHQIRKVLFPN